MIQYERMMFYKQEDGIMIKSYAVVSKNTGNIVGRFVVHPGQDLPKNLNNMTFGVVRKDENDEATVSDMEDVFLSSSKGNIDKLDALCEVNDNQLCVINGKQFGYEQDVVLLK